MEPDRTGTNDAQALRRQLDAGTLTWRGPAVMLFARSAWAVVAQALVAAIFAWRSSPTPSRDAEPWLPVHGTLVDAGCLALLWQLTRREGLRLLDLVGFVRVGVRSKAKVADDTNRNILPAERTHGGTATSASDSTHRHLHTGPVKPSV